MLVLLLSHFSCVRFCATPWTAAHHAPPSLGFSRQEHWSGLPFPSPMHESEEWKWSHSVVSDSSRPHGLQPTRILHLWDFPGKNIGAGCHFLFQCMKVKSESEVDQLCPTLSDPMDCSPPGSSVHGIFQARVLEWGCHCLLRLCHFLAVWPSNSYLPLATSVSWSVNWTDMRMK